MKRIQYHRYGGPEEMRLEEYTLPVLGKGEILVRVKAASVNPFDWKLREGVMKFMTGNRFPRAMGQDFSGVVEGVGPGVTRFKVGDKVFGTTPAKTSGSFAETLITQEKLIAIKPAALSHEDAATLPIAGGTAWKALIGNAKLKSGQKVFINGAYGAVGQAATRLAIGFGAKVTGRVSGATMKDAEELGMDTVLDYNQKVPDSIAGTYDVVFDCHGSLSVADGNRLIKRGGIVIDTNPSGAKMMRLVLSRSRKFVMGAPDAQVLEKIATLASSGKLKINIGRTVALNESIELIKALEAGQRVNGKGLIVAA